MFTESFILIAAAVIPALFLLIQIYREDKLEKEPAGFLVRLVLWGIPIILLAFILESACLAAVGFVYAEGSLVYDLITNFLVVGLAEEWVKLLLLNKKVWKSPHFNCLFDGIVYAVTVSLGFALWENITYVFSYGFVNALLRAVTAIPGHACFGVFMGVYYGLAKYMEQLGNAAQCRKYRTCALLIPALLHGAYDFTASRKNLFWLFLLLIVTMFVSARRIVRQISNNDHYIVPRWFW